MASGSVSVSLVERSYDISISTTALGSAAQFLTEELRASHAVWIVDQSVSNWLQLPLEKATQNQVRNSVIEVPSGETSKSIATLAKIWDAMQTAETDRMSVIVAVGGGVVGDLAGFAAATFARGVRFIQIPTTLLAMVDSSVGGKTGINLATAKNMVGSFWQPVGVFINPETLSTLPRREFLSGLAEVVKYGVIQDEAFFQFLEQNTAAILSRDEASLVKLISRCCELKAEVVAEDERETSGRRAILNYGHTFAHAFENLLGYGVLLHGEAVSIGMDCAARLALKIGRIESSMVERQRALLRQFELPVRLPELPVDDVIRAMQRDKKVAHGKLRFVLPDQMGHVSLVSDVSLEAVRAVLESESAAT